MKNITIRCPKCNGTRWKTKIKGKEYQCRSCGFIGVGLLKPKMVDQFTKTFVARNITKIDLETKLKWWQKICKFIINLFKK